MEVCILGSGPAGLLTALAVELEGHKPYIISKGEKSPMFGAMYLHRAIPKITNEEPDFHITIDKIGTRQGYARNVYGDPNAPVSWDVIADGEHPAWNLPLAYNKLWDHFLPNIHKMNIQQHSLQVIQARWELVFSTIPLNTICYMEHEFDSQPIWVSHGPTKGPDKDNNLMQYNGLRPEEAGIGFDWYRYSQINGYSAWEFSHQPDWWLDADISRERTNGYKPITSNCTCWPGLVRLGRFGTFRKGVLTHDAFEGAMNVLQNFQSIRHVV